MSERKIVRMSKSEDTSNNLKFFEPRFIEIQRGETIYWINDDTREHNLLSHRFREPTDLLKIGPIAPGETQSRTINYGVSTIDYFCSIHPEEVGTIVILEKKEEDLTNTENFRKFYFFFLFIIVDAIVSDESLKILPRQLTLPLLV